MTEANDAAAENQINKHAPVVVVEHSSMQCYFRPDTEELVYIADQEASTFEQHWKDMTSTVNQFHLAKAAYSSALETYEQAASTQRLAPLSDDPHALEVIAAETRLEKDRQALREKLGEFSTQNMSYDDVVELIPVMGKGQKNKRGSKPARFAYVKKGYFTQNKDGRKLHTVSLKGSEKKGAQESIYSKDKHGNRRIDTNKLKEQLTTLKWEKVKLDMKDIVSWTGLDIDPEALNKDFALFDWAQSWNESLVGKRELGASVDVSGAAQFMRFVSNVGASVEFDPEKGNIALKGEAKANQTLVSGMVNLTRYIPDRLGWALRYTTSKGNAFDMGMLRLYLAGELSGFVGASVQVEAQLQVVVVDGREQKLAGQPNSRLPRFSQRRTQGSVFHQQMAAEDDGLSVSAEAFGGARVEGGLKGGLQWLKPTPPVNENAPVIEILKSSGEFTDFCNIGQSIGAMAGVGAGGKFHCTFINGRFCFHVAASVCCGVGAKGMFVCEVEANTITEFGAWLIYQLYRLGYGFFDVVERRTFEAYSQYCVMQIADVKSKIYNDYNFGKLSVEEVSTRFRKFVLGVADKNKENLDASKRRNQLAKNIISNPADLLLYTPETKGVLLYLLTRHGIWDHLDWVNRGDKWIPDIYSDRKDAVIWVLKSIQTRAEWNKVLCRMTADGRQLHSDDNQLAIIEQQEQHLVNFLKEGFNRDQDLYKAKAELATIYDRLKSDVTWGYALAMNDSAYYKCNTGHNAHYLQRCTLGSFEQQPSRFS
ncbi:hypothetical protein SAMN04487857_1333 [Pseudomonas sp. ok272]|uniref:hypothetical protein n=1 Tax=unclassified Pseudomonas TaxID=196821 RepID=UPI0008D5CA21|nr:MULTISPECIES: hypothetical protein [unclassified Pseudomonas]SEN66215.1 hypothetical protein SAMN04487857_1333 [Pseudomonas sp. ok272]SFN46443.1 hypothetical protein SAMN04487858_1357 [Pseudomonas sp. ok602]